MPRHTLVLKGEEKKSCSFFSLQFFLSGFQYNLIPSLYPQALAAVETLKDFLLQHDIFLPKFSFLLRPRIFQFYPTSSCEEKYLISRLVSVPFFFKLLSKIELLLFFFLNPSIPTTYILVQTPY